MGHLGRLKEEYRDLARRLQDGTVALPEPEDERARAAWQEILEILFTPEEAALAGRMPLRPVSLDRLSRRLGIPPEALRARLEPMCDKGVVMDLPNPRNGRVSYLLSPPVVGFFEYSLMRATDSIPKKRMAEALHAYTHGDEAFAREAFSGDTTIGRALVHETALAEDPLPEVARLRPRWFRPSSGVWRLTWAPVRRAETRIPRPIGPFPSSSGMASPTGHPRSSRPPLMQAARE